MTVLHLTGSTGGDLTPTTGSSTGTSREELVTRLEDMVAFIPSLRKRIRNFSAPSILFDVLLAFRSRYFTEGAEFNLRLLRNIKEKPHFFRDYNSAVKQSEEKHPLFILRT